MSAAWTQNTGFSQVCRRAGGRRAYNARRQVAALARLHHLHSLVRIAPWLAAELLAERFSVSRATIFRDLKKLDALANQGDSRVPVRRSPAGGMASGVARAGQAGSRTAKEHAEALKKGEPMVPTCFGGTKSEGQRRDESCAAGLPVREPEVTAVEVGIDRVYAADKQDRILVSDDCTGYGEEKMTYDRKLNERGEPIEAIEDKKERVRVPVILRTAADFAAEHPGEKHRQPGEAFFVSTDEYARGQSGPEELYRKDADDWRHRPDSPLGGGGFGHLGTDRIPF